MFKKNLYHLQKLDDLEERLSQVTKALNIISKSKQQKIVHGDESN